MLIINSINCYNIIRFNEYPQFPCILDKIEKENCVVKVEDL